MNEEKEEIIENEYMMTVPGIFLQAIEMLSNNSCYRPCSLYNWRKESLPKNHPYENIKSSFVL